MSNTGNIVLSKMLDRLLAGLMSGPNMNCRPHKSRQRVDLTHLARLQDATPEQTLLALLDSESCARTVAKVKPPKKWKSDDDQPTPAEKSWIDQSALLTKLRVIADDARTYENDTGVHALSIGFPLLSLPPGSFTGGPRNSTRRILAPIAFIPVALLLKGGATPSVEIACRGEGADRVLPNTALLSWIEQQTGKAYRTDAFEDEEGVDPWREIRELAQHVADAMRIELPVLPSGDGPNPATASDRDVNDPSLFGDSLKTTAAPQTPVLRHPEEPNSSASDPALASTSEPGSGVHGAPVQQPPSADPSTPGQSPILNLSPAPHADDDSATPSILLSAVLGLFPTAHQGLLRDTHAMLGQTAPPSGPIQNFLASGIDFDAPTIVTPLPGPQPKASRTVADEKLAAAADPCQSRAVALARQAAGLVIHGPPGTGKSQTITNIICDHLARGLRVLLVCEKRTALDVVADRLEHMGLRSLCGIVHDPQRDQRDLYKSIHEQLADLPEAKLHPRADGELAKADAELQQLHDELAGYHKSLMEPAPGGGPSFHELMGRWMSFRGESPVRLDDSKISGITVELLESNQTALAELFERAAKVNYFKNPWTKCAGIALADFLSRQMSVARTALSRILAAADAADATADDRIPPFTANVPLQRQAAARVELANHLAESIPHARAAGLAPLAAADISVVRKTKQRIDSAAGEIKIFRAGPIDSPLIAFIEPSIPKVKRDLLAVNQYLAIAGKWWSFFAFKTKSEASAVLKKFALPLSSADAGRIKDFLLGLESRLVLSALLGETKLASDERIEQCLQSAAQWLPLLEKIATDPALSGIGPIFAKLYAACGFVENGFESAHTATHAGSELPASAGSDAETSGASPHINEPPESSEVASESPSPDVQNKTADFLQGLRLCGPRADSIVRLEEELAASTLFAPNWLAETSSSLRAGKLAHDTAAALSDHLDELEGVLRVRAARASLPAALAPAADQILAQAITADDAVAALQQKVLSQEITHRLRENPTLQSIDGHRVESGFDRFRELEEQKKRLVRDVILHHWISRQKGRLLAGTGSRLNSTGADLRRRLISRGERAMRLRQVIAIGRTIEGGDPLFDLCPAWMASPETVAQIFPRSPLFDVVIFDEASQCRLEEALPVLTRGRRLVIAGDPNQLPPTRFFESGLVQSEEEDPQTDQELFETQQGEIEDLLSAALNLSIQQCYLDVHYRSRNADLIEFSNRNFYARRLQAIPGHPSNRSRFSPLTLYRVDGTYSKRRNEAEADRVVQIVYDLLKRASPPSIGIACLNLPQRDLITEKLDDRAAEDADFARRLAAARSRKGQGSFEGLFVKNLENVQGDERDDIIISTTYGPDINGKFYRRFGPLGMAGGGRRLNVLVTRARNEVHLVTSIPPESYRSLPAVPEGQSATGAWLLFAYLKYAEELAALYGNEVTSGSNAESSTQEQPATVNVLPSRSPSLFSKSLAESLAASPKIGSDVHWGNDGFSVDLALHHPQRPGDVTIGVLCDGCRYTAAEDALVWDIFRTSILTGQGWKLRRIWTPHFFRDPQGNVTTIEKSVKEFVMTEKPADALPTMSPF